MSAVSHRRGGQQALCEPEWLYVAVSHSRGQKAFRSACVATCQLSVTAEEGNKPLGLP